RAALLTQVEGDWGNTARADAAACQTVLHFAVSRRDGSDFVTITGDSGGGASWESVGRVLSAEGGAVTTRTVSPADQAGERWVLRPTPRALVQIDSTGKESPLARCD